MNLVTLLIALLLTTMPSVALALAGLPEPSGGSLSLKDLSIKEGVVIKGKGQYNRRDPITLVIDGDTRKYSYYVWIRLGRSNDSWWKRLNNQRMVVLATEEEFKNLQEGAEVKIYYKNGYWPFFVSKVRPPKQVTAERCGIY